MRDFKDSEYSLFKQICFMSQDTLKKNLCSILKDKYDNVICTDDYIYAVGDIPIALVAHMDTVFPHPPTRIFYDREANVCWSPEGLGADDRAGIFAILYILKTHFRPSIIFTTDEEKGCLGADKLTINLREPMSELKYIVQLDRRGKNDCVFYDCENNEFTKYIESFGFNTAIGSFSDISVICPMWRVAGVNLSIGYFNEHSVSETLNITFMFNTIRKVLNMLSKIDKSKKFEYIESPWVRKYNLLEGCAETPLDIIKCDCCGKYFDEYEMFPVKGKEGKIKYYCCDCISEDRIGWCKYCQDPFEKLGDETICPDCADIIKGVSIKY